MGIGRHLRNAFSILADIGRQILLGLRYLVDSRNRPIVALSAALATLVGVVFYLLLRYDNLLRLSGMSVANCAWTNELQALAVMIAGVVFGLFTFVSLGEVLMTLDQRRKKHPVNWRDSMLFAALAIGSGSLMLYLAATNC